MLNVLCKKREIADESDSVLMSGLENQDYHIGNNGMQAKPP
jgi:hypothetical protein